ncbi:MAG: hypothetical protein JO202_07290 [Ktedonobacteraceae bacterium]|nr:hypothetical protein [Ktedonobacteraceae bacterium]
MEDTYTSSEARERLGGMASSSFKALVDSGAIRKVTAPGRKQGVYRKEDVDRIAEEKQITPSSRKIIARKRRSLKKRTIPDVILDWVRPEDVPSGLALDQIVYHEMFLANAEVYMAWRRKNSKISMGAFDAKDRRVRYGYIGLIPLPESVILDVLMGKKDEKEITPDEILTYDEPGEYTLLANSAVIHPDYPELANSIIHAIMKFWIDQYPEKRIKRIYAQTVSEQGRTLAKKLYLGPLYIMRNGGLTRVEDAYVLDMQEEAASKIIRQFQERLRAKEQQSKKR